MSTTSCFAPRSPDCIVNVGQLCKAYSVKHLVNNAYGLQSAICRQLINEVSDFRVPNFFAMHF